VFDPKNLENLPIFVINKGLSMAAAICFVLAFWQQWRRLRGKLAGNEPALWFRAGVLGVVVHVPMSLAILEKSYFKEFFLGEKLSMNGEAIFLFGALTAGGVYLITRMNWAASHRWWLSLATMFVLLNHTLFMGIARGINIKASHAYLPPMWMLSVVAVAFGILYLLMSRPHGEAMDSPGGSPG
jgi:hypothetical protein